MPGVKDLVGAYETRSAASSPSPSPALPPPTRARFIHPLLEQQRRQSVPTQPSPSPAGTISSSTHVGQAEVPPASSPQRLSRVSSVQHSTPRSTHNSPRPLRTPDDVSLVHPASRPGGLARPPSGHRPSKRASLPVLITKPPSFYHDNIPYAYPSQQLSDSRQSPDTTLTTSQRPIYDRSPAYSYGPSASRTSLVPSFSSTLAQSTYSSEDYIPLRKLQPASPPREAKSITARTHLDHTPIPAKDVFARNAWPLHLPALDKYISNIPVPSFSAYQRHPPPVTKKGKEKVVPATLFPPFEMLGRKSIDELSHNSPLPQFYNDRNYILNSIMNGVLGFAGSSAIANYYSLQGVYQSVQVFALVLNAVVPIGSPGAREDKWRTLFLETIPNILALNIPTKLKQSLIFLIVLMVICGILLHRFYVLTEEYCTRVLKEGRQSRQPPPSWSTIIITFLLTVLYLPLSTIAMHGILWSSDFWIVENPYISDNPDLSKMRPLGDPTIWRDPLDFCYTTTMRKDQGNWAPLVVVLCAITFFFVTIWFPARLMGAIKKSLPLVDPYTELGRKRSEPEMELEYERVLSRDTNPFSFLYKDFRRRWGTYNSVYLWAKLSALLIVAIISSDNCAFRSFNREMINIVRQIILTTSMLVWFLIQCFLAPFLDPVTNASEWTSRVNYLITSAIGLLVALNVPGKDVLNGIVLYIVYVITYGLNLYFSLISASFVRSFVKRFSRRIDFSIDIYSPKLDITASSPHIRHRIWQETLTTLILTDGECKIPPEQKIGYADSADFSWPPYLLNFQGTPAERHVENLKILREVGLKAYLRGIALATGTEHKIFEYLQYRIEKHFVGPDCFWKPLDASHSSITGCKAYFGNAWWIPFPPTLVISFDNGGQAILNSLHDLEMYVHQNESPGIQQRRCLRLALRALDRQIVTWPYTHVELVGSRKWFTGRQYSMQSVTHFHSCVFELKRRGTQFIEGFPLGSGFDIQLTYAHKVQLDGDILGLNDDFDLSPLLAKFLHMNQHLINDRIEVVESALWRYRKTARKEARRKRKALSYGFTTEVWNWPAPPDEAAKTVEGLERDLRVRHLILEREDALLAAKERMDGVGQSEIATWWYLFWDDFWRQNHTTYSRLEKYAADFDPHHSTSIAYRPLPRAALETFLTQRGLFSSVKGKIALLHHGFLNKMYFRLNQIAFHGTEKAILVHVGSETPEIDLDELDMTTHVRTSTIGTGGGTDHDDANIRVRPMFKWEEVFEDPMRPGRGTGHWVSRRRWAGMIRVWLGVTPLEGRRFRTNGVALDLRVEGGRYVTIERAVVDVGGKTR